MGLFDDAINKMKYDNTRITFIHMCLTFDKILLPRHIVEDIIGNKDVEININVMRRILAYDDVYDNMISHDSGYKVSVALIDAILSIFNKFIKEKINYNFSNCSFYGSDLSKVIKDAVNTGFVYSQMCELFMTIAHGNMFGEYSNSIGYILFTKLLLDLGYKPVDIDVDIIFEICRLAKNNDTNELTQKFNYIFETYYTKMYTT